MTVDLATCAARATASTKPDTYSSRTSTRTASCCCHIEAAITAAAANGLSHDGRRLRASCKDIIFDAQIDFTAIATTSTAATKANRDCTRSGPGA